MDTDNPKTAKICAFVYVSYNSCHFGGNSTMAISTIGASPVPMSVTSRIIMPMTIISKLFIVRVIAILGFGSKIMFFCQGNWIPNSCCRHRARPHCTHWACSSGLSPPSNQGLTSAVARQTPVKKVCGAAYPFVLRGNADLSALAWHFPYF